MPTSHHAFSFIDIHYHADPDLYKRRHGAIKVGKYYKKINGAVVLKSHLGSTSVQATIAQQEGLPVFPSIVLNKIAGGINYMAVLRALAEYQPVIQSRLIVHLPTITGRKHKSNLSRDMASPELRQALFQIESELIDIFKLTRDYPIVLSTGHASKNETYALIEACDQWQVPALLLNQPANPLTGLKAVDLQNIAKQHSFVWTEQTALTYLLNYQDELDFSNVLNNIPKVIYSSDLGQNSQMDINEWLIITNEWFTNFNVSPSRKEEICLANPLKILEI
jgi:hypothetical protein